jgi:uncharacterized protein (DUF1697 family)
VTAFVGLLRAVNVSGKNRILMAELRTKLEAAGFGAVRTYVQSGNVVFAADGDDPDAQAAAIHRVIDRAFGRDVNVLVLTAGQLEQVAAELPFIGAADFDDSWVHVTFLSAPADEAGFAGLTLPAQPGERAVMAGAAALAGRVVYLYLPHGYGRTKLNNAYFERALKTPATTRNWRTVMTLAQMSAQGG